MIDEIKGLFDRRIVAEGVVHYREDGTPVSITSITSVRERRQGRPLEEFIGATPSLTGGLSPEEFLATVHGDE